MKLRTKFSLLISLLVVIIISGVTVFLLIAESKFLVSEMESSRISMINSFAQVAKESSIVKDDIMLINYVKFFKNDSGLLYAYRTDKTGRIMAHTDTSLLWTIKDDPVSVKTQNTKELLVQRYDLTPGEAVLDLSMPVIVDNEFSGIVRIGFSQKVLDELVKTSLKVARKRIFMVSIAALIVGLLGAIILTGMMTGPINKIAAGAQIIGQGKLDHKIEVKSKDELGDLSREFNRMSDKLKELDQLKSDFVSSVTHELRSPLISLRMYINTFLEDTKGDLEKQKEYIGIMGSCAGRLNNFIDDLLDIAKIERGKMEVSVQSVDLMPIINETIQLFTPQFAKKKIDFKLNADASIPAVSVDPERTRQVLTNLLSNALKFTPEGGSIQVSAALKKSDGLVEIAVKDTGVGIPKDEIGKLFNKFEQVKSTKSAVKGAKGTGLGLAIIKGILQAQGGTVRVESELNKGSTFIFTLLTAKE